MRIINKFGGEIIENPRLVKLAVRRIKEQLERNQKPVVVVSALAGITDKLGELGSKKDQKIFAQIIKEHEKWIKIHNLENENLRRKAENLKKELENDLMKVKENKESLSLKDKILAYGEKWSSLLFTQLLVRNEIEAELIKGEELIITDENFGDANILYQESLRIIKSKLKNISQLPVISGFIGKSKHGKTTTLGRGGSDTTACLVCAGLKPSKVILWKNVPGVLSADPKIVNPAKLIKFLSYEKAEKIGKVIHNKGIRLIKRKGIEIEVAYILDPQQKTIIGKNNLNNL